MPDFISAVTVNPSWTNITANSGMDVNKPLRVFNNSSNYLEAGGTLTDVNGGTISA